MRELLTSLMDDKTFAVKLVRGLLMAAAIYHVAPDQFWAALAAGGSLFLGAGEKNPQ